MPRTLRSGSRRKKLQVQHIQQVNKSISINKCIETNIVNFNQIEFLSLFGLTQIAPQNGQRTKCDRHIKRTQIQYTDQNNEEALIGTFSMDNTPHTIDSSTNDYNEAYKIRYALGKCLNIQYDMPYAEPIALNFFFG